MEYYCFAEDKYSDRNTRITSILYSTFYFQQIEDSGTRTETTKPTQKPDKDKDVPDRSFLPDASTLDALDATNQPTERHSVPDADDSEYHESNASTQGSGYQKGRTSFAVLVRVRSTMLEMLRVIRTPQNAGEPSRS
ncbi:hypothetical protein HO173_004935 [Letharia columbiana]|uniref:Uncharacterized protein n=1 Tax=Letharia columbiana TaxID=112416 RepID=A0A8H6FXH4_9LECA|nr:uncharacterized protein HO173_004935 [Letharia columbiana]KAF6236644.1 hypothetical protein HO173_004935 [Letharia columbiana]